MSERRVDVAILGGGLASGLLARQLRRQVPEASVAVFEKSPERRYKVGEATVEIASNYFIRKAGLSTYLFDEHLPKNGLRLFFDTPEKDAELTAMSEIGTDRAPPTPSFQLNRSKLDADLREMNAKAGAEVNVGWTAKDVRLGRGGEPHRFAAVRDDGERREYRARWLIDATGRASTLARALDLRFEETEHQCAAVWGRFTGVLDIDSIADDPWRRRARYVARILSTNHFCYPGYWIWFIPLGKGVTSVGVVGLKEHFRRGMRTQEGFRAFLDEHAAVRMLLEKAEPLDIDGYTQLAYGTKRFFSEDRWALVGEAAAFTDPFYSPGSDFIALECDYVTDLVARDVRGEPADRLAERTRTYDEFLRFRWEANMLVYRGLYGALGSYELMRVKFNFDFGCYFNLWFDPFSLDKHLDLRFLGSELRRRKDTLAALRNFASLFRRVEARLRADGTYHRKNLGEYNLGVDCLRPFIDECTTPRKRRLIDQRTEEVFNYGREESLKLLGHSSVQPLKLYQFAEEAAL